MNLLNRIIFFPAFFVLMSLYLAGTLLAGIYGYFKFDTGLKIKIKWLEGFYPEYIKSTTDKIAFHEYVWNTGAGKFGSLMGVINNLGWGTMLLAVFHLDKLFWLVPIAVFAYPLAVYSLGYFLHRVKYVFRSGDVLNKLQTPPFQRIEDKVDAVLNKLK